VAISITVLVWRTLHLPTSHTGTMRSDYCELACLFFPLIFTLTCTKCVYYKMLIPPTYDDQFPCYKKGLFACYYVQQLISFPLHAHRGL
jgi:uncharacterized membrane protein YhdT